MKTVRVNLYAGPDAGKSTIANFLTAKFKMQKKRYKVEYVNEMAKDWAYSGLRMKCSSDQFLLFANQKWKEELYLMGGARFVITDSPLLLAVSYSKRYGFPEDVPAMMVSEAAFESKYPSVNILINKKRNQKDYNADGRYQNDCLDAADMDSRILSDLKNTHRKFKEFAYDDAKSIYRFVKGVIDASD